MTWRKRLVSPFASNLIEARSTKDATLAREAASWLDDFPKLTPAVLKPAGFVVTGISLATRMPFWRRVPTPAPDPCPPYHFESAGNGERLSVDKERGHARRLTQGDCLGPRFHSGNRPHQNLLIEVRTDFSALLHLQKIAVNRRGPPFTSTSVNSSATMNSSFLPFGYAPAFEFDPLPKSHWE